jgi:hypothetical protein
MMIYKITSLIFTQIETILNERYVLRKQVQYKEEIAEKWVKKF